ncbi:bifunctional 2-C-methyl-D-erythritol 4-phosphate cytidylyltransferase/2-C-methyl-D-erythritol 2,4-cyclodiphosphate synthase [Albidovulum sp.]|uniref:bifunctional 2-C-methyl-D-erythritol 4-phosphate cytidylyltransferase/2-C-methyl-D-erythritol 2,4-cyclodiphosphate synthase n=1 Tax=Albidovulum sp. TaxID=1872424 RepID=UPI001DAE17DC|nr:bifunctional 2-C-methyl-D-erythritol 4-phosphate cytidylyltransferase/2-C-methyl-D-erythritol 2,4-cyclodiphosphate synthase [Paracoccaceae bacterium]HPE24551.1 bifunctional 2-C-methyl-D-erythritol 4-phosphate cytidylyltransferase/2-C-methyl-D-erythritol 2,4-cyclodiphosphate synthase [Albidovulum sp.]MCB2158928.1 bifunctional 2-C-methyl-D-erythritol 4-phosphate cytidylyltransferase/2-C-methyl-D-erythritol 2,4-cyclodiphosphate synthase [Paracoccaceae bacterium]MCP5323942.1 bifunctional 2-C-meth
MPATRESTAAVIVAAGRGERAGGDRPKQWQALAGRPVLSHAVEAFSGFGRVVVVLHPDDMEKGVAVLGGQVTLVAGGTTRAASVHNALDLLDGSGMTHVLIHDGARPLVSRDIIDRVLGALDPGLAAAPALPVTDALWRGAEGNVAGAVARDGLFRAQTPQGFGLDAILAAHRAHPGGAADDVEVARHAGIAVAIVQGAEDNIKITWPDDLVRAERLLGRDMDVRLGNGYDVHAFCAGDHVTLCGVRIAHDCGLLGHSDADVGMHALTDAIYGALADGDIGRHFPPSDPQWKGAASEIFLAHAAGRAAARGFRIANADVTLVCEAPKIGPHADAMRAELARIMGIGFDRVSVKATTSERLGFTGRREGIAALATASLVKA